MVLRMYGMQGATSAQLPPDPAAPVVSDDGPQPVSQPWDGHAPGDALDQQQGVNVAAWGLKRWLGGVWWGRETSVTSCAARSAVK